jgi:hypothetical protein
MLRLTKMPYHLQKAKNADLYWVVNSITGKRYSILPISRRNAEGQLLILRRSLRSER